jgi:hypothetical protein
LDEDGKLCVKGFNVAPKGWLDTPMEESEESEDDLGEGIDPDDPMRDYLIEKRRQERLEAEEKQRKRRKGHSKDNTKKKRHCQHDKRIKNEEVASIPWKWKPDPLIIGLFVMNK